MVVGRRMPSHNDLGLIVFLYLVVHNSVNVYYSVVYLCLPPILHELLEGKDHIPICIPRAHCRSWLRIQ